ncbi:transporter substrate-binding domain-containing protein [Thalassospira sp. MA62]|nr:transporter substrate-binding domain-containing protein [Thalassospira sp. MA62]
MKCCKIKALHAKLLATATLSACILIMVTSGARAWDATEDKPAPTPQPGECRTLSVGGADGWEPITYTDNQDHQTGLGIDVLRHFVEKHDITLDLKLDIPWTRSLKMLEAGELDVIAGAYFTEERARTFVYTSPFAYDDVMVFQHQSNLFRITGIHDLIGHRGVRPQGGSYGDFIDSYAQRHLDMIYSPTGNQIFNVLLNGRVDYVLLGRYDGLANLMVQDLMDTIIAVEPPLQQNAVHLIFSPRSPCASHASSISAMIERLEKDGTLDRLTKLHLGRLSDI